MGRIVLYLDKYFMILARSYSHHSLLSAVPQIPALVADAKLKGYTSIALTDEDTGSGFLVL
jgi:DNA polymerase III alpha subunit